MPIQVKARDVAKKFNEQTVSNVERLVAKEIGAVKAAFQRVLKDVERDVDAHFERQEKAGLPPYPDATPRYYGRRYSEGASYSANVIVLVGNVKDQRALAEHDVAQRLADKVTQLLSDAGFECATTVADDRSYLALTISDPRYEPIDEAQLAESIFEERVKDQD
jgi:hypothetical protein